MRSIAQRQHAGRIPAHGHEGARYILSEGGLSAQSAADQGVASLEF